LTYWYDNNITIRQDLKTRVEIRPAKDLQQKTLILNPNFQGIKLLAEDRPALYKTGRQVYNSLKIYIIMNKTHR